MAKWSGIYLDDSLKLLKKVEKELEKAWKTREDEPDDSILVMGRTIYANELQAKIKKWRREMFNEEGEK